MPANGSGYFDIKTTLTFQALRLLWANFFDSQLPLVRSWNVHPGVKFTKNKVQNFALREDIGLRVRLDQEISTQEFFQEAFSGDKIASRANHEHEHEEPTGGPTIRESLSKSNSMATTLRQHRQE
jgi:hypothetical protein